MPARGSHIQDVPIDVLTEIIRNPDKINKIVEQYKKARQEQEDAYNRVLKADDERAKAEKAYDAKVKADRVELEERKRALDAMQADIDARNAALSTNEETMKRREHAANNKEAFNKLWETDLRAMEDGLRKREEALAKEVDRAEKKQLGIMERETAAEARIQRITEAVTECMRKIA